MFTTFSPAISGKAATGIRQQIRRMRFHLRSDLSFQDIAKMINAKVGAWAAYFGRFRPSETAYVLFHIDRYLLRWARRKYKHLRWAHRRAWRTLAAIENPGQGSSLTGDGNCEREQRRQEPDDRSPVSRICRAPDYAERDGERAGRRELSRSGTRYNPGHISEVFF